VTLFNWFVPCLVLVLMLFLIWCVSQGAPSAERRRMVRTIILVGCLLEASIILAILDDKGARLCRACGFRAGTLAGAGPPRPRAGALPATADCVSLIRSAWDCGLRWPVVRHVAGGKGPKQALA